MKLIRNICIGFFILVCISTISSILTHQSQNENYTQSAKTETTAKTPPTKNAENTKEQQKDIVVVDKAGIKVTVKGTVKTSLGIGIKVLIENNTDHEIAASVEDSSINGYMIDSFLWSKVSPGKKTNETIIFYDSDINRTGIANILEYEFYLVIENNEIYEDLTDPTKVTLKTDTHDLYSQSYDDSGFVVYDSNGIKIAMRNLIDNYPYGLAVEFYAYNGSDEVIRIDTEDDSVNGYMVSAYASAKILPGKHIVDIISIAASSLEENNIKLVEEYEFRLEIIKGDRYTTTEETELIKLTFAYK